MSRTMRLLLVFAVVWWRPSTQEGSGLQCTAPKKIQTDCENGEKIRLFRFSASENHCEEYLSCPMDENVARNVFTTRETCEESCPVTECLHPSKIENGFYYMSRSEDGSTTVHYACMNSYKLVGPSERKCQYDGSWAGDEPNCKLSAVTCSASPNIEGATKHSSCFTPGCLVVYSCNELQGWDMVYGTGYRRCGKDGNWVEDLPICARLRVMQDESEVNDEIKATDGQTNFEVQCVVEPEVPSFAVVQWTREGGGEVNGNTHWLSNKSLALSFDKVNLNDAGKYKCEMNLDKNIERFFDFVVLKPSNLVDVDLMFSHTQIMSHMITLTAVYKGSEKPAVDWYFNEEKISPGSKYTITDQAEFHPEINFNVLNVVLPSNEDFGSYYAQANQDNTTREWFELSSKGATGLKAKRSLSQRNTPPSSHMLKDVLPTTTTICSDETTDVFVGKFKKALRENLEVKSYILNVSRRLRSSFVQPTIKKEKTMLVAIQDERFALSDLSFRESYIFIVRTDRDGRPLLTEFYPYSEVLETVMNYACS